MKKNKPSSTTTLDNNNTLHSDSAHFCSCCCRHLSLSAFYVNKKTLVADRYCKECRKALSRKRYAGEKVAREQAPRRRVYPVITQIEDRETRLALILNALRVVAERMEARRRRINAELEALL